MGFAQWSSAVWSAMRRRFGPGPGDRILGASLGFSSLHSEYEGFHKKCYHNVECERDCYSPEGDEENSGPSSSCDEGVCIHDDIPVVDDAQVEGSHHARCVVVVVECVQPASGVLCVFEEAVPQVHFPSD